MNDLLKMDTGHLSGKAFRLADPQKLNQPSSIPRHPSAPLRPTTRQVSIKSDKSRASSAVSTESRASSTATESRNNYRLSLKDAQSRPNTTQSLCRHPGTLIRYEGQMNKLEETEENMSIKGSGTPMEGNGAQRKISERPKKSKSAKITRPGSHHFRFTAEKATNQEGKKGQMNGDQVNSVLKASNGKTRATSVPSWFYGSKLKSASVSIGNDDMGFPSHQNKEAKTGEITKVNKFNTWMLPSKVMIKEESCANRFNKNDDATLAIQVKQLIPTVTTNNSQSMEVKGVIKSSTSLCNQQFMDKEIQGGITQETLNQGQKDSSLKGDLPQDATLWHSSGNRAFTKREAEALKDNVVDSLLSPRLAKMKPGILRSLPLESELNKYLHYLNSDKKRSGTFTKSQNRYVPGVKFRPGGAINRPYVSPSPTLPPNIKSSAVPNVTFDSFSEGAAENYNGGLSARESLKGSRGNSGKTSIKMQLRESVLRQSQLSVSASTSVVTESVSS